MKKKFFMLQVVLGLFALPALSMLEINHAKPNRPLDEPCQCRSFTPKQLTKPGEQTSTSSKHFPLEIVVVSLGYFHLHKFAGL